MKTPTPIEILFDQEVCAAALNQKAIERASDNANPWTGIIIVAGLVAMTLIINYKLNTLNQSILKFAKN